MTQSRGRCGQDRVRLEEQVGVGIAVKQPKLSYDNSETTLSGVHRYAYIFIYPHGLVYVHP